MSGSPVQPAASRRNAALDGLRGWAAVSVIYYHVILGPHREMIAGVLDPPITAMHGPWQVLEKILLSVLNGEIAVELFFVMSGLVLFRSLMADRSPPWHIAWSFPVRRVLRIWPAMAVCLVANVALFWAIGAPFHHQLDGYVGWDKLATNLALIDFPVNGATWTLHAEIAVIPIILLCWAVTRVFGRWALFAGLLICAAPHRLAPLMAALVFHDPYLLFSVLFFLTGMAVERGLIDWLVGGRLAGPAAALAALVLYGTEMALPRYSAERLLLQDAAMAVIVGYAYRCPRGFGITVLSAPLSRMMGRLSYSLYLWNVPIFEIILAATPAWMVGGHPLATGMAVATITALATIPIAHVSDRFVEQPCIALGRRLSRGRVRAAAPATPRPSSPPAAPDEAGAPG